MNWGKEKRCSNFCLCHQLVSFPTFVCSIFKETIFTVAKQLEEIGNFGNDIQAVIEDRFFRFVLTLNLYVST